MVVKELCFDSNLSTTITEDNLEIFLASLTFKLSYNYFWRACIDLASLRSESLMYKYFPMDIGKPTFPLKICKILWNFDNI